MRKHVTQGLVAVAMILLLTMNVRLIIPALVLWIIAGLVAPPDMFNPRLQEQSPVANEKAPIDTH